MMPVRRFAMLAALAASLAGCAAPPPSRQVALSNADRTACRQRADEIYAKQNRDDAYRTDSFTTSSLDSPYASNGLPGITTRGLSGAYARDTLVSDCLNSRAGAGTDGSGPGGDVPRERGPETP